ncbi:hypothetical protein BJX76DRAFT_320330 [Aspergillus varians]
MPPRNTLANDSFLDGLLRPQFHLAANRQGIRPIIRTLINRPQLTHYLLIRYRKHHGIICYRYSFLAQQRGTRSPRSNTHSTPSDRRREKPPRHPRNKEPQGANPSPVGRLCPRSAAPVHQTLRQRRGRIIAGLWRHVPHLMAGFRNCGPDSIHG